MSSRLECGCGVKAPAFILINISPQGRTNSIFEQFWELETFLTNNPGITGIRMRTESGDRWCAFVRDLFLILKSVKRVIVARVNIG